MYPVPTEKKAAQSEDRPHEEKMPLWLRKTFNYGKIVLPCKPKYRPRDKSFFQGRFAVDSIFVQGIPWTRISRMGELC
jgi:hypothetical protein